MERNYNVSGADRKALVKVIGEALGVKPKYMGTPSYALRIGGYEVSQHGVFSNWSATSKRIGQGMYGLS